jgi:aryl-alcohol dehydrogenase-like predicted oxidoreductase
MTAARLALGTAQLGMDYGVANQAGRPSPGQIDRILRTALDLGVDCIDTAAAYGEAEVVIGLFLRDVGRPESLRVCTKVPRLPNGLSGAALCREVGVAVDRSRRRLGLDTLDALLLHAADDLREYGEALVEALVEHRDSGRVRRIGVSVYDEADARVALSYRALEATQFPFSVFDRRVAQSGIVERLRSVGHETFARSSLQQGLLALSPECGQAAVPGSGPWLSRLTEVCGAHHVEPVWAAVGYAAVRSGADYLVVGVESADQLLGLWRALQGCLTAELVRDLDQRFSDVPAAVRDPRRWCGAA